MKDLVFKKQTTNNCLLQLLKLRAHELHKTRTHKQPVGLLRDADVEKISASAFIVCDKKFRQIIHQNYYLWLEKRPN